MDGLVHNSSYDPCGVGILCRVAKDVARLIHRLPTAWMKCGKLCDDKNLSTCVKSCATLEQPNMPIQCWWWCIIVVSLWMCCWFRKTKTNIHPYPRFASYSSTTITMFSVDVVQVVGYTPASIVVFVGRGVFRVGGSVTYQLYLYK